MRTQLSCERANELQPECVFCVGAEQFPLIIAPKLKNFFPLCIVYGAYFLCNRKPYSVRDMDKNVSRSMLPNGCNRQPSGCHLASVSSIFNIVSWTFMCERLTSDKCIAVNSSPLVPSTHTHAHNNLRKIRYFTERPHGHKLHCNDRFGYARLTFTIMARTIFHTNANEKNVDWWWWWWCWDKN